MRTPFIPFLIAAAAAAAPAQSVSVLFTTSGPGHDATASGSSGTMHAELGERDIGVVTPAPGASAETFLCHTNLDVMHGDKDCDAVLVDLLAGDAIDALVICENEVNPRLRNLFFSVKSTIGTFGLTPRLRPGDVGSTRVNGQYAYLIREEHIRDAFAIPAGVPIDVDAVEQDDDGTIYLSLEDDTPVFGGAVLALDGDLLAIPGGTLSYDGCQVVDTSPGSGVIVATEAIFDARVVNSGVSGPSGAAETIIADLDGLCRDPNGGTWVAQSEVGGVFTLPNFLFCGEALEGAAVLSTRAGGQIAMVNGQPLAKAAPMPTDGIDMGLRPGTAPIVRPLDGLEIVKNGDPVRLITDVEPALPIAPVDISIDWGGADPGAPVVLVLTGGAAAGCFTAPSVPIPNPGLGYWFGNATSLSTPGLPSDAFGFGNLTAAYAGGVPAGLYVVVQPISIKSGVLAVGGSSLIQF